MHPIIQQVLELSGFDKLNPVQEAAARAGLLDGKNFVVAAPTASGKTVIAEIAALSTIKKGKKVIYIVPLRALANEKYEEFKEKYRSLGIKVAISIGDMDSSDSWLENYDIIIVTSEKIDSLLRHGIRWLHSVGLVVADEIHLLDSPERGPTLEVVLTRLRQVSNPNILALSATINNYKELAEWLDAVPIKSDYRPVKLYKGICYDGKINFQPQKEIELYSDTPLTEIITETLEKNKQALVFILTRRSAESTAEKMGEAVKEKLTPEEIKELGKIAQKILSSIEHPTKQCKRLSDCVKKGTAFHHAGLTNAQRNIIESAFKQGVIKIISATPTLAAGINLPAYRVIIRDLKRYSSYRGMDYIPVLEIEQMVGRAGRPKYDSEGEGILLPKNRGEAEYAWDNYILGEPEKIYSKLGVEPVLRMHVLSLIASEVTPTKQALFDFFAKTFYAHQYKDLTGLNLILERIINLLENFNFVATSENKENKNPFRKASEIAQDCKLYPTKIGKRVSELYIDPLTAHKLIQNTSADKPLNLFNVLQAISNTIEMKPLPGLRKNDFRLVDELLALEGDGLLEAVPNAWDLEYDDFLCSIKMAAFFQSWCSEAGENDLLENYGITPGELRARLERADWLLYAFQELTLLIGQMESIKDIRKVRLRIKYGIKEELLPLIKLKGIGRVRARMLYNAGLKRLADLRKIPLESLEKIIGHAVAREIKDQLGELEEEE